MIANCRACGSDALRVVVDYGEQPIANALLTEADLAAPEPRYPLALAFCQACAVLQVTETVPREVLYENDYPFFTSASSPAVRAAGGLAQELIARHDLGDDSLVLEVGSNDGYLLRSFLWRGIPCLGVDPAAGPCAAAEALGIPVICDFFGSRVAEQLVDQDRRADVVVANNVIAHVANINDLFHGIARVLKPSGVAVLTFAYAVDMIEQYLFDLVYHEHLFYHTLSGLVPLLQRHGLYLQDAEPIADQGGSLRVTAGRTPARMPSERAQVLLRGEAELGVARSAYYEGFAERAASRLQRLRALLLAEKAGSKRIACYGAPAKGTVLLNLLGLGEGFFAFAVDSTSAKQGKHIPGVRVPICPPYRLLAEQPDRALLLAWNYADAILRKESTWIERGGRFILPLPTPRIVSPAERSAA